MNLIRDGTIHNNKTIRRRRNRRINNRIPIQKRRMGNNTKIKKIYTL